MWFAAERKRPAASVVISFQLFLLLEIFNMKSVSRKQIKAGFFQQKSVILRGIIHDHA